MKEISIEDEVFSQRLLLFMEREPQSNKYGQIILNSKQFGIISDALASCCKIVGTSESGKEILETKESDADYTLPDLQEIHDI